MKDIFYNKRKMIKNNCPICKSTNIYVKYSKVTDINFQTTNEFFSLYECKNCKALFINPLLDEKKLNKYYPISKYLPFYCSKNIIRTKNIYDPFYIKLKLLQNIFPKNSKFKLIDLGCGGGYFLYNIKHYFPNADLTGVDSNKNAIISLKSVGIDGINESIYNLELGKKYDVICAAQVLEHLRKPHIFIKILKELSNKSSIFLIDVPNLGSYSAKKFGKNWVHLDVPRHQINYTYKTLKYLFNDFITVNFYICGSHNAIISSFLLKLGMDIHKNKIFYRIMSNLMYFTYIKNIKSNISKYYSDKILWFGRKK